MTVLTAPAEPQADPAPAAAADRPRLDLPMPSAGWRGWLGPLLVTVLAGVLRFVDLGRPDRLSFDEIANRIDHEVADAYEQSFDALSSIQLDPAAPSSGTLESLRRYAGQRRDASRELADALRRGDQTEALRALGKANAARIEAARPSAGEPAEPADPAEKRPSPAR